MEVGQDHLPSRIPIFRQFNRTPSQGSEWGFQEQFIFVSFRLIISLKALQSRDRIQSFKQRIWGVIFAHHGVMPAGPELLPQRSWVSQKPCPPL